MNDLVSVIVPVYNTEKYLKRCLESIQEQSYTNLEVICIDDGSTDNSRDILKKYATEDSRFIIIHKLNGGLVSARKEGVKKAQGKYICHIDSDDWIEKDMIYELMRYAEYTDADIITSGLIRDYGNGRSVLEKDCINAGIYDEDQIEKQIKPIMLYTGRFFETGMNLHLTNKIFRADISKRLYLEIDERIRVGDDAAIIAPFIVKSHKIVITHDYYYHYVLRSDSCMGTRKGNDIESLRILYKYLCKKLGNYLLPQISVLLIYHLLLMTPDKVFNYYKKKSMPIPFIDINTRNKYVVYGAGKFGVSLYDYLKDKVVISGWLDENVENELVKRVDLFDFKDKDRYDKVIIAALNYATKQNMIDKISTFGVKRENIFSINLDENIDYNINKILEL